MEYIQVKDICKQFGKELVLKNVSVGFDKGKIHGIVGRNGCGRRYCCA